MIFPPIFNKAIKWHESQLGIFENNLYIIWKKILPKSTCQTGTFTCPGPSDNGTYWVLQWGNRLSPLVLKLDPWMVMPWLLASPGHQQLWFSPCMINKSSSSIRKEFNFQCHLSVEKWQKMKIYFYVTWNKFSATRADVTKEYLPLLYLQVSWLLWWIQVDCH